jgi:hypothetical protein
MQITTTIPPVFEAAHKQFQINDNSTVYAYGDTLHNPANIYLEIDILVHEETHMMQQQVYEGGAKGWWERYLSDPAFRTSQEIEAYGEQYIYFCYINHDRNAQARQLMEIAKVLAGPMYNTGMGTTEAMTKVREWKNKQIGGKYSHRIYPTVPHYPQEVSDKNQDESQAIA